MFLPMPSVKLMALLSIGLLVGLGTGLGAGYVGLNPQVNNLQEKVTATEAKSTELVGAINSLQEKGATAEKNYAQSLESREKAEVLLQNSLGEKDMHLKALESEIAAKRAELLDLQSKKTDADKTFATMAALETEIQDSKSQLKALKSADVRLI